MYRLLSWWFILSTPVAPVSPNLQEREKFRKARLLSIILLAVILITLCVFVGTLIAQELSGVAIILVFLGFISIAIVLNRHGFLYIAAAYFLGLYLSLATIGIELCVRSAASSSLWAWMAVTIVPIIAGFVLPFWAPLIFASVDILILGEIYTHQFPFGITSLGRTDQVDMISFIIFMTGLLAILSSIYAHSVKQGVKALDRTSELEAANHALEITQTQLQHLSITDPLTGICNQRAFYAAADRALAQAHQEQGQVAILFLDGDHFKHINDIHGHAAGDATLRYVAQQTQQIVRDGDLVARYGGEEFIVLLPTTSIAQACDIAESIRSAIAIGSVQEHISITVSVGVAAFPMDGVTLTDVIKRADQAMYTAKQQGRNRVCTSADIDQTAHLATISAIDERQPATNRQMMAHLLTHMAAHHETSVDRLAAVMDAFAGMTETRSYKEAHSLETAMQELQHHPGAHVDPDIIAAFIDIITTAEEQQLAA